MPQLLFKKAFHAAILSGRKTTTLRRWRVCRMRAGDRVKTPGVGELILDAVGEIKWESLTDADARADGFTTLEELSRIIRKIYPDLDGDGKSWFKLRFHLENAVPAPTRRDPQSVVRQELASAVRAELDKAVQNSGS